MNRVALWCLSGLAAAGITACSGTSTTVPEPSPTATVTAPAASPSGQPGQPGQPGLSAAEVVTSYYQTIVARNYRRAFTYLAATATGPDGRLTLQSFLQLARMLDSIGGPVTVFSVGTHLPLVVMTLNRQRYGPYHAHLQMARAGSGWTIISIDRI